MLKNIALFEFKTRLSRLSTWVYFLVFLVLAFMWIAAAGGLFQGGNISFGSEKVLINSPFALAMTTSVLGLFGVTIMAALMGRAVQQDAEYRTHHFFFTTPITKRDYLGGRFIGAFGVLLVVFVSIGLGSWLATLMPGLNADRLGPNRFVAYGWAYVLVLLPNALFVGLIFFVVGALSKKMLPVYVGSVLLLIGYLIAIQLTSDLDHKTLAAYLDPFGMSAVERVTEYWTVADRNTRLIPIEGDLLWNRILWLAVAAVTAIYGYRRFSAAAFVNERSGAAKVDAPPDPAPTEPLASTPQTIAPVGLGLLPQLVWLNLRETVKNIYFGVLVLAGLLFLIFASTTMGGIFGTTTWPVTYQVTALVGGSFRLFMLILITFYAGELIWRERDHRVDQLLDATPMPTWLPLLSKLLALMLVPVLLQVLLVLCGIVIQMFKGYFHFELDLYFKQMLGLDLLRYWLICVLAIAIHSVVNHKYLGHFLMIVYYIAVTFSDEMGFSHNLYKYGVIPSGTYSDMNGFGHFLPRMFSFQAYWSAAATLLVVAGYLLWTRGTDGHWRERLRVARARLRGGVIGVGAIAMALFVGMGAFIYNHTNVLNRYETKHDIELRLVDYEKKYKATALQPQPSITAVNVKIDLYPREQGVRMVGSYRLKNKNAKPVNEIWLGFAEAKSKFHQIEFDPPASLAENDERLGVRRYRLATPMAPGAEATLRFDLEKVTQGFTNTGSNTQVVYNGSFINGRNILPVIGYQEGAELARDKDRKKFGLLPKERMPDRDDPKGLANNYIANDADWIDFEAVIGTEEDQIAIAPGYLQKEWKEGGRRYFSYKMDVPILNFFALQSARYAVKKDKWRDVPIEIYYHPGHEYNLTRMIDGTKASLEYFSNAFGLYQHKQFRIIEFPRYASFAQAFPNTIPYSEGIGFIARVREDDEKDIDYPYYITSHEVAHQWWGHQLIGGAVQGGTLLSETLSEYSAMMVMKQKYGEAKMQKFLAYSMDRYLLGRGREQKKELPLARVENQSYIHYNKGSVVMYALQDYIGEDKVNQALKALLAEGAYKGPPYPNATLFLKHIRAVTPAHLQYMIDDMFENIIVYDNRTTDATYKEMPNGKFSVTMKITAKKRKAGELGKEEDVPLADWIDIGVLDEKNAPIFLEKRKIEKEQNEITVMVDRKPTKAGIDPYNKLIDRQPKDNAIAVTKG